VAYLTKLWHRTDTPTNYDTRTIQQHCIVLIFALIFMTFGRYLLDRW